MKTINHIIPYTICDLLILIIYKNIKMLVGLKILQVLNIFELSMLYLTIKKKIAQI